MKRLVLAFACLATAAVLGIARASSVSAPGLTATGTPTAGYVLTGNGAGVTPSWQAAAGGGGTVVNSIADGRLTLTSGTPVTTADVNSVTNVYYTPYKGNTIALHDGASTWSYVNFTETTLALGTLTANLNYDVFGYSSGGTLTLEALGWTNDTTRATALVSQNGVWCKTGATTRRYLGTFRTTSTTVTCDSAWQRLLFNANNRSPRACVGPAFLAITTWTTTAFTAPGNPLGCDPSFNNQVVIGLAEDAVSVLAIGPHAAGGTSGGLVLGIGIDSSTTNSAQAFGARNGAATQWTSSAAAYLGNPGVGYHTFYLVGRAQTGNVTTTVAGANNAPNIVSTILQ